MQLEGEYEATPTKWVRDQIEAYEASGGKEAATLRDTGIPIIVITTRGNKTGKLRKTALMRVEHNGEYALIGSLGGAPKNPVWVYNLEADPTACAVQDGPEPFLVSVPSGPSGGSVPSRCSRTTPSTRRRRTGSSRSTSPALAERPQLLTAGPSGPAVARPLRSRDGARGS